MTRRFSFVWIFAWCNNALVQLQWVQSPDVGYVDQYIKNNCVCVRGAGHSHLWNWVWCCYTETGSTEHQKRGACWIMMEAKEETLAGVEMLKIFLCCAKLKTRLTGSLGSQKRKITRMTFFGRWSILMSQLSPWVSAFFCRANKWSNTIVKSLAQQGLAKVSYGPIVECKEDLVCCGWKEFNMLSLLIWFHLQSIRQLKNIWKCIFCWETGRRYLLIYWMQCGGAVQRNSLFNEV